MQYVSINSVPNIRRACLKELNGLIEHTVSNVSTPTAVQILDELLVQESENDLAKGMVKDLVVTERDLLLAKLYEQTYGPNIETYYKCQNCNVEFEINFNISDLHSSMQAIGDNEYFERDDNGNYRLDTHHLFRLPTGDDELSIVGLPLPEAQREFISRCTVEGDFTQYEDTLEDLIKRLAPIVDTDISAQCPECHYENNVHFNLQTYVLSSLVQEKSQLLQDVHCLASNYGWSLNEILSLDRNHRRALVQLVEIDNTSSAERNA